MTTERERPRIGISACLLGKNVRFDGGHKRSELVLGLFDEHVDWVPVCPEVEVGLPVPRPTLRLTGTAAAPRLVEPKHGRDLTDEMNAWSRARADGLAALQLDGYILKKDSPSCGLERVRVYGASGVPTRDGAGLFAAALRAALPALPLTEEGWLVDHDLRESFLARVFTHQRLRLGLAGASPADLVRLHAAHKLLYMAHEPAGQKELGRLVAGVTARPFAEVLRAYAGAAMRVLSVRASRGKHVNVLMHILGYFRDALAPADKQEVLGLVEEYRRGLHELAVPLTLLRHHLRRHERPWLEGQVYFEPYPRALTAR